ncbi:hypothetical protein TSOC_011361 [Tetrabaena socialis]|uniref:Uncharacterized protein n=1 Tax=Tetrabaena socialis TaxID=47790 RepID=A0A2J7ZQW7_9CHLO|nr:hypothetical protein TSOC_011361 [Tetrabaena socialis]|eukprot:PNH02646.1 hypothetical protein TSOC_011361 [Tetrabaena socialis]
MLPDLGDDVTQYFKSLSDQFKDMEGVEVVPTFVPASQINSEIEFELEHNLTNSHDGWILDPMGMGTIFNFDGFQDLTPFVRTAMVVNNVSTDVIRWDDVHPYFQNTSVYYDSTLRKFVVVTLPLDGNIKLLYYRRDLFATYNLSVPRTWDEVVSVASSLAALNLDLNNDGIPDSPFCFDRRKDQQPGPLPPSRNALMSVLIFRGPRVRMGLHAGVHSEHDISHSKGDGRTTYSGDTVVMARAVAGAAQGGTALLSEETYKKLPLERLWDKYLVLHMGEHRLRETLPHLNLYHALNRTLEGRLAYVGPMSSLLQLMKLVQLLPGSVRSALEDHPDCLELLEVVMDLGRPPLARFPSGDVKLSADPISAEDLDFAVQQVGNFGGDNRAGIDRTLHRISCMRNRTGRIIGLTCRVGRAIKGSAQMVRDLASVPIYAVKTSGAANLVKAFRTLLGIDPSAGDAFAPPSSVDGDDAPPAAPASASSPAGSEDEGDSANGGGGGVGAGPGVAKGYSYKAWAEEEAVEEAQVAVTEIVIPLHQPVELMPRARSVLEAQIRLLERYGLPYEIIGAGADARLRILPRVTVATAES